MPRLVVTKNYRDGTNPTESQLDSIKSSIEVFFNNTKLGDDNLQDNIVDPDMITAEAVTAVKIDTNAVTQAKVGTGVVDTDHIQDGAVTTAKLGSSAVTQAKWGALNVAVSSSTTATFSTSAALAEVSGYAVSITTNGNPVFIHLQPEGTSVLDMASAGGSFQILGVKRGSTPIAQFSLPTSSVLLVDKPAAGTYTYQLMSYTSEIAGTLTNFRMVVWELR